MGGFHECGDGFAHVEGLFHIVHAVVGAATTYQLNGTGAENALPQTLIEIHRFNFEEGNFHKFDVENAIFLNESVGGDGEGGFAAHKISPGKESQTHHYGNDAHHGEEGFGSGEPDDKHHQT